jgi:hypothetical protein
MPRTGSTVFLQHPGGCVIPWVRNRGRILRARWSVTCGESGSSKSSPVDFERWRNDLMMTFFFQRYFRHVLEQFTECKNKVSVWKQVVLITFSLPWNGLVVCCQETAGVRMGAVYKTSLIPVRRLCKCLHSRATLQTDKINIFQHRYRKVEWAVWQLARTSHAAYFQGKHE